MRVENLCDGGSSFPDEITALRLFFRYLCFLSCTGMLFILSMVAVILFYKFFVRDAECKTNLFFVSFSLCQCVAATVISVLPKVQEAQSGTG